MERRYNGASVYRTSSGVSIRGTASVTYDGTPGTEYQLWEGAVERIAPGAFDTHLGTAPDVLALFNHNADHILGRTPDTLKLTTDKRGLHYEITPVDTQASRDVMTNIAAGNIRGSSFAFAPEEVEWTNDGAKEVRIIKRARLYDVSPVTTPAYGGTTVGVRSEERGRLERERDDYRSRLETEKRLARLHNINSNRSK